MYKPLLFTEQTMNLDEKEQIIMKHLNYLIVNFDHLSKPQIKQNLMDEQDLLTRYS